MGVKDFPTNVSTVGAVTDGHLAVFDGTNGEYIKDGGAVPSGPTSIPVPIDEGGTGAETAAEARENLGVVPLQMVSAVVQTDVGTKQALLLAVPTGMQRVIYGLVARKATASLAAYGDDAVSFGFDAGAGSVLTNQFQNLADVSYQQNLSGVYETTAPPVGVAGEIYGILFAVTSAVGAVTIDVFFYDVPA